MSPLAFGILVTGWLAWVAPFFLIKKNKKNKGAPQQLDRRARWGIALQGVAFALVWQGRFWTRSPEGWRIPLSILFFALAGALSWTSARTLGQQWRFDAGLNPDHELVQSGAYRFVRHPIYASMIAVMLGTGFLIAQLPLLPFALALHLVGTEIRVRIEDALLAARFGDRFREYQGRVPAYISFVR